MSDSRDVHLQWQGVGLECWWQGAHLATYFPSGYTGLQPGSPKFQIHDAHNRVFTASPGYTGRTGENAVLAGFMLHCMKEELASAPYECEESALSEVLDSLASISDMQWWHSIIKCGEPTLPPNEKAIVGTRPGI